MIDDSDLVKGVAIILGLYWLMFIITYVCMEADWDVVNAKLEEGYEKVLAYWYCFVLCIILTIPVWAYTRYVQYKRNQIKMEEAKRLFAEWWDKNNNS